MEEEIKADREQARYDEVTGDALDKVDDAESEMNDKLTEAEQDILDAKVEIEDGWSELLEGKQELLDGENKLTEAERTLQKAQRELERAERELVAAEKELDAAWKELESGELLLEVSELAIKEGKKPFEISRKELEKAREEIPKTYDSMKVMLESQIFFTDIGIRRADVEIWALETEIEALKVIDGAQQNVEAKQVQLDACKQEKDDLLKTRDEMQKSLDGLEEEEKAAYEKLDKAEAELAETEQELLESEAELIQNKKELEDGRKELEKAQKEFDEAKQEIKEGWVELENGWDELEDAYLEILEGKAELEEGEAEFEEGKQKYEEGVKEFLDRKEEALDKITDARQEIEDIKMASWYISTRTALSGYANVKTDAQCIESIGNAFPILFMVVAILISLTTISRMVEEDRGLIGTYKALGFTDKEIRRKYSVYALLACLVGGLLGLILGFIVLPSIIFIVFGVMYLFTEYSFAFNWLYGIGSILLFVIGIVGAAVVSCESELRHMPAMLMRPKAPKNGSRVLLERVTPIWSKLSFLNKVTARNLFRYKKRLFMTLFGIAGCTAILLTGFTIKDTIVKLLPLQYGETYMYDFMVVSDDNEVLMEYLKDSKIRSYINPMITNVKVVNADGREETVQLVVVSNEESLRGYINLVDRNGKKVNLEDGMVLSTINVAEVQGYDKGDTITLQNLDLVNAEVEITDIVMNYLGNVIYMTEHTYEDYFDDFAANGALVMLNEGVQDQAAYAKSMSEKDHIFSCVSVADFLANYDSVFYIIDMVVWIVITLAAALAFTVLFTLSTTNISERERELATIKVLGFFDREVHLYVNKETLILTTLGIFMGMPLGKGMGVWLMSILKMPSIYFADYLAPMSYLYAMAITIVFAIVVNTITDKSLDVIDPVEALKSIE